MMHPQDIGEKKDEALILNDDAKKILVKFRQIFIE